MTRYAIIKLIIGISIYFVFIHYSFGQTEVPWLSQRISLNAENIPLDSALRIISREAGINFSFNPDEIPLKKGINFSADDMEVEDLLDKFCDKAGLSYAIVEQQVILKLRSKKSDQQSISKKITMSGIIRDEENGEVLIGATLQIPSISKGTITNAFGFYSITLPEGQYKVIVSYLGYEKKELQVSLTKNTRRDLALNHSEEILEEIIVSADDRISTVETAQMSTMNIKSDDLMEMPTVMGEGDIIKSLQSVPGIKMHGDGSTLFFVRGGDRDQNLILLDDAPIYNPAHLIGLFSTFIPEAVKDINIYKGDIPARQGGRLSSLIDIRTNDGNLNRFAMNGTLGLLSAKLGLEIPVVKEKSSLYISGRQSHIEWFFKNLNSNVRDFYFYDFNTKFNWKINDKNRFYLTYYSGEDKYSVNSGNNSSPGIQWNNQSLTFRWNHIFNDRLFSNTTLYGSSYDYYFYTSLEQNNRWSSTIANLTLKTDFSWYINPENTFYFGFRFGGHNINPGNFLINGQLSPDVPYVSRKHAREWALYAENEHKLSDKLELRYGFRLSVWENTGEAIEIEYNENLEPVDSTHYAPAEVYHSYGNLEPRLNLVYLLNKSTALKFSYSRTSQYLHLINNSISPFNSLDVWLPSGPNIPDQTADQLAAGVMHDLKKSGLNLSAEVYYKNMNNQIGYVDHANMLLNPLIESELRFGKGWSYGLELLAEKITGRLQGWASYTLSRSWLRIDGINRGNRYPAFYDRPHEFSLYLMYDLSKRTSFSSNWYYATGAAITAPSGFYYYQGHTVPAYDEKNNDRFPPYHRLDLSLSYRLNKKPGDFRHYLGFSIFNIYGRKNPVFYNYNKIEISDNNFQIPGDLSGIHELVSTRTYVFFVVPSISYKFNFR